ncbi:MAG TPA: RNA polymerase sigma factor [Bacteroides sp.]|nr:RNA polymerase sigma factor [Bacteroides sp.]
METIQVIQSCIRGDEKAFRQLIRQNADFAFRVAFRIVNNEEDAKDIVQESFITVWEKIREIDPGKKFSSWLYRIIVNKCYDMLRRRKRMRWVRPNERNRSLAALISESNPESLLTNEETGRLIRHISYTLSPKQKIVFVLGELEGLSHDDIAEITGMNKTSVKSNLNHARRKIGERIKNHI